MHIGIVGAGLAGFSAGTELAKSGHKITIFDKGRGPGGRMATRRVETTAGEAQFDHGAQYFTVRDPSFAAQVERWAEGGIVARWPAAGDGAWVGTPAMNMPVKALASSLDVEWNARIEAIERDKGGWRLRGEQLSSTQVDALVLALPAEQAAEMLAPVDVALAALAGETISAPCWTVMAAFGSAVPHDADVLLADGGPIGWAARNSAKPGRGGPEAWVIQGTPIWSADHLEDSADSVVSALMGALATRTGPLPASLSVTAHRWRYARSGSAGGGFRWNATDKLGLCGDWLLGPRVEAAWLSGHALAHAICA
jgi:renalase